MYKEGLEVVRYETKNRRALHMAGLDVSRYETTHREASYTPRYWRLLCMRLKTGKDLVH